MSTALVCSSAPQPQKTRATFYNGSWPFREGKEGPQTRILQNCCSEVTLQGPLSQRHWLQNEVFPLKEPPNDVVEAADTLPAGPVEIYGTDSFVRT
jgi:hypothetical protein